MTSTSEDQNEIRGNALHINPISALVTLAMLGTGAAYGILGVETAERNERLYWMVSRMAIVLPIVAVMAIVAVIVSKLQAVRADRAERRANPRHGAMDERLAALGEGLRAAEHRSQQYLTTIAQALASQEERDQLNYERGQSEQYVIGKAELERLVEQHQAELQRVEEEAYGRGREKGQEEGFVTGWAAKTADLENGITPISGGLKSTNRRTGAQARHGGTRRLTHD